MHRITLVFALLLLPRLASADTGATPFVDLGWRVMGLADHPSHGPDFQAGVRLWDHLKIGLGGFARPGPINPRTFQVEPADPYRGQTTLDLRSDGAVVGLLLAPAFRVGRLEIELPVILGYGAFGFYLVGEDRETPDGERVSVWEDRLLGGADSGGGFALDFGVRLGLHTRARFVRPFLGLHYTTILGYDATLADRYDGFSGVLGVHFGQ